MGKFAFKSDFFRLCWLYQHGGVYADVDTVCVSPNLRQWLDAYQDVDIILTRDDPTDASNFYQAFIYASRPHEPFLKRCIDKIIENIHGN